MTERVSRKGKSGHRGRLTKVKPASNQMKILNRKKKGDSKVGKNPKENEPAPESPKKKEIALRERQGRASQGI